MAGELVAKQAMAVECKPEAFLGLKTPWMSSRLKYIPTNETIMLMTLSHCVVVILVGSAAAGGSSAALPAAAGGSGAALPAAAGGSVFI